MFKLRSRFARHGFVPGLVLGLASCRTATQIDLNIRTNLPCTSSEQWKGVAVYLGKPGAELENAAPTLVTTSCDGVGHVGDVVVAPSGEKDEAVGIRVVAGISRKPEDCQSNGYAGCIVARRTLHFNPHSSLDVDVVLSADCVGFGCDAEHTCLTGGCVDNPVDAPPTSSSSSGPSVRCGDNGVVCGTTGDVCCLAVDTDAGTTLGRCLNPKDCPPTSIQLNCDDDSDCVAQSSADGPGLCMLSYDSASTYEPTTIALSECLARPSQFASSSIGLALCEERKPCNDGVAECIRSAGAPNQLPGYFWCKVSNNQ